jgi:hypothetical protein
MIFIILATGAALIGSLLWIDHRACGRRLYYAAPRRRCAGSILRAVPSGWDLTLGARV